MHMQDVGSTIEASFDGADYRSSNLVRFDRFPVKSRIGQLRDMNRIDRKCPCRLLAGDHKQIAVVFQGINLLFQASCYTTGFKMIMQEGDFHCIPLKHQFRSETLFPEFCMKIDENLLVQDSCIKT